MVLLEHSAPAKRSAATPTISRCRTSHLESHQSASRPRSAAMMILEWYLPPMVISLAYDSFSLRFLSFLSRQSYCYDLTSMSRPPS